MSNQDAQYRLKQLESLESEKLSLERGLRAIATTDGKSPIEGLESEWYEKRRKLANLQSNILKVKEELLAEQESHVLDRTGLSVVSEVPQRGQISTVNDEPVSWSEPSLDERNSHREQSRTETRGYGKQDRGGSTVEPVRRDQIKQEMQVLAQKLNALPEGSPEWQSVADQMKLLNDEWASLTESATPKSVATEQYAKPAGSQRTELVRKIRNALNAVGKPLPGDIQDWIDAYARLAPDETEQLREFNRLLKQRRRVGEVKTAVKRMREKIDPILERARILRQKDAVEARRLVDQALDWGKELRRAYPDSDRVRALFEELHSERNEIIAAWATAQEVDHYEDLIAYYEKQQKEHPGAKLPYKRSEIKDKKLLVRTDEFGNETRVVGGEEVLEVSQIVEDLKRVSVIYAEQKAEERLNAAKQAIASSDPRRAHDLLHGAGVFKDGNNERLKPLCEYCDMNSEIIGALRLFRLPEGPQKTTIAYFESVVLPALKNRIAAEKLRDESTEQSSVLPAWSMLLQAQRIDPETPLLEESRQRWHNALTEHLDQEFRSASGSRARHKWKEARLVADSLLALVAGDSELVEWQKRISTFIKTCDKGEQIAVEVQTCLQLVANLLGKASGKLEDELVAANQADEELRRLQALLAQERDTENNPLFPPDLVKDLFPGIAPEHERILARLNLNQTIQEAEQAARSGDEATVKAKQCALEEIRHNYPGRNEISQVLDRLGLRLTFLAAERDYKSGRYTKLEQYDDLLGRLQTLSSSKDSPNARLATEYLQTMKASREATREIEQLLVQANAMWQAGKRGYTEEDRKTLRHALRLLQPYENKVFVRGEELDDLRRSIIRELTRSIEVSLAELDRNTQPAPADAKEVFRLHQELDNLDSQKARAWSALLARAYLHVSENSFTLEDRLKNLEEADTAILSAPHPDPELKMRIRNETHEAQKLQRLEELDDATGDPARQEEILEVMLEQYSNDPEILLRRAQLYILQGRFTEARIQSERAERALDRVSPKSTSMTLRLHKLSGQIDLEERIAHAKQRLVQLLDPERDIDDLSSALTEYQKLMEQVKLIASGDPQPVVDLEGWWKKQVEDLVSKLEQQQREWQTAGLPQWRAAEPMLKILQFQRDHLRAKRAVNNLATDAVAIIGGKVAVMEKNLSGPSEGFAELSLERDILESAALLEQAQAYRKALEQSVAGTGSLETEVRTIRKRLDDLSLLKREITNVENNLRAWALIGSEEGKAIWQDIEEQRNALTTGKFKRHRRVRLVLESIEKVKMKREHLEQACADLPIAVSEEDFGRALELIEELKKCHGDESAPAGSPDRYEYELELDFHVQNAINVSLDELETIVLRGQQETQTVQTWLRQAITQVVPWRALPHEWLAGLDKVTPFKEDDTALMAIDNCLHLGDFKAALLKCSLVIGVRNSEAYDIAERIRVDETPFEQVVQACTKSMETSHGNAYLPVPLSPYPDRWCLRQAADYLGQPPLDVDSIRSEKATRLIKHTADVVLAGLLRWMGEANDRYARIPLDQSDFETHMNNLYVYLEEAGKRGRNLLGRHWGPKPEDLVGQAWREFEAACKAVQNDPGNPICELLKDRLSQLEEAKPR